MARVMLEAVKRVARMLKSHLKEIRVAAVYVISGLGNAGGSRGRLVHATRFLQNANPKL